MQIIYPTLLLGLMLSPLSYADCSSASKQAALKFINGYVSYLQHTCSKNNRLTLVFING